MKITFSKLKNDDNTASSEHVVAPGPLTETSVTQVEHKATKIEEGYCTTADSGPSSEAIMELEADEETPAAVGNETIADVEVCKDPESHASGDVLMAVESSDPNLASAIQPDTLNLTTQVPVLLESRENISSRFQRKIYAMQSSVTY